jgi:retron-type reverse transcriptase
MARFPPDGAPDPFRTVRALQGHRIADRRIIRLIKRWLKAGILESGEWTTVETGSPQGSGISPILANVFGRLFGRGRTAASLRP